MENNINIKIDKKIVKIDVEIFLGRELSREEYEEVLDDTRADIYLIREHIGEIMYENEIKRDICLTGERINKVIDQKEF